MFKNDAKYTVKKPRLRVAGHTLTYYGLIL